MPNGRILFDGWPLVYAPLNAAAWHLRMLLAVNIEGIEPLLALPTEPAAATAAGVRSVYHHTHDRGAWQQRILPRLAAEHGAQAIHTTGLAASLFGKQFTLVSPAETERRTAGGRLDAAMGRGGLARALILWPSDLPAPHLPGVVRTLPPVVHAEFRTAAHPEVNQLDLPEEFLLVHGLRDEGAVLTLLESWTWAAASIGELYPLVLVGLDKDLSEFVGEQLPKYHVENSVRVLGKLQPQELAALYRACTALVHLGPPAAWGNPLRAALAAGKAVVAQREASTESIVGAAAYLTPPEDLRGFGAALITMVVDETARQKLEGAAQQRAAGWKATEFEAGLAEIYREVIK
jgi:glycosyltransferase involved in cell wall biosynthesis